MGGVRVKRGTQQRKKVWVDDLELAMRAVPSKIGEDASQLLDFVESFWSWSNVCLGQIFVTGFPRLRAQVLPGSQTGHGRGSVMIQLLGTLSRSA